MTGNTGRKPSIDRIAWIIDPAAGHRKEIKLLLAHFKRRGGNWRAYEVTEPALSYCCCLFVLSARAHRSLSKDRQESSALLAMGPADFPVRADDPLYGQIVKYLYNLKGKRKAYAAIPLDLRDGMRAIFDPRSKSDAKNSWIELAKSVTTDDFCFWHAHGLPDDMLEGQTMPADICISKADFPKVPVEVVDDLEHRILTSGLPNGRRERIGPQQPTAPAKTELRHGLPYCVPNRPYYQGLTKHEQVIESCLAVLERGLSGQPLVIWGMGGLGKSTLAAEMARRYARDRDARGVLWVPLHVSSCEGVSKPESLRAQVADTMAVQLGLFDRLHEPSSVRLSSVAKEEALSQSLLVIDNLDPSYHPVHELATVLEEIQPKCTVVTSRPSLELQHSCQTKLTPLSSQDGVRFLQIDAKRRNIDSVLPKAQKALADMCKVTGGVPFAMQLALGQATRLPWQTVLERCAAGQSELYYYLFRDLWKILDPAAKKTLIYMRTAPDSVELDELLAAAEIGSSEEVLSAVDELVKLALLDVGRLGESSASYQIHPLTHNFITTELPRVWSEEDEAQG